MASEKVTRNVSSWDFAGQHVQQNCVGSDFVGSHSVVICATVPRAEQLTGSLDDGSISGDAATVQSLANNKGKDNTGFAYPIGIIDSSAIQQDRNLAQIFEIGSTRSYLMSARTITQMTINRVLYNGPSLLRCLYAYYPEEKMPMMNNEMSLTDKGFSSDAMPRITNGDENDIPDGLKQAPGYDNFWMNLASEIFSQPLGLVLFVKDNNQEDVAALFLEECYVQNHSFSMSANSVVMAESCSIRCDRILPISVRTKFKKNNP